MVPAARNSTSVRGRSTSRICRFPASKTSPTMRRSSALSVWVPVTSSRTSCSVIAWRPCRGSAPSSRTTTLTDTDSSHTTGRAIREITSRVGAANSAIAIVRWSASRFGASSLNTRVRKVMHAVTTANASGSATSWPSPCWTIQLLSSPASVSAP